MNNKSSGIYKELLDCIWVRSTQWKAGPPNGFSQDMNKYRCCCNMNGPSSKILPRCITFSSDLFFSLFSVVRTSSKMCMFSTVGQSHILHRYLSYFHRHLFKTFGVHTTQALQQSMSIMIFKYTPLVNSTLDRYVQCFS